MTQPALLGPLSEKTPALSTGPRLIAFDLSLTATGWAGNIGGPVISGVLRTKGMTGLARVAYIRNNVRNMAADADLVLIEGLAFGARGDAMLDLAGLAMVVRLAFEERGKQFLDVANNTIKKFATGKGNAQKADMLAAAIRRLDYQGSDHNESDALWLLQMALHHYGCPGRVDLPAAQLASLAKVKWPQLKARAA